MSPQVSRYKAMVSGLAKTFLEYPLVVSLETYSKCNASCGFCPYHTLERKGERMDMALITKIIADLKDIPAAHKYRINPSRVNEPFLDRRIFDICELIEDSLPNASLVLFSNGTPLTANHLARLSRLKRVASLNISFNDHRPNEYAALMGLNYRQTIRKLSLVQEHVAAGELKFPVNLSRVEDGTSVDQEFIEFCNEHFPALTASVSVRGDWMGEVDVPTVATIPDLPCSQWFKLHFLANGEEAFCCIDANGRFGSGNARNTHVLDLYNHPVKRQLRERTPSRLEVDICCGCVMLS